VQQYAAHPDDEAPLASLCLGPWSVQHPAAAQKQCEGEPHRMTPVAVCPESPGSDRVIFMQDMSHRRVPPKPGEAHGHINLEGTVKVGADETSRVDAFQARVNATGLINNDLREEAQGS